MSAKRLRNWIIASVAWLFFFAALYVYAKYYCKDTFADILEHLILLVVAIPAAILAGAFNRRNSYLQALRDLWQRLIPAVQSAIQYTHLKSPRQSDYAKTQEALSTAIDELRGVFKNVPTKRDRKGLYPYENLKDILDAISWLGYGKHFQENHATRVRQCITRSWHEMHSAMLGEFDRDVPIRPVSKYLTGQRTEIDLLLELPR